MVYGLQMPWTDALWFGAMISVSSTMVVLKMVAEGVTNTLASKVMIGLLLVQDLAVIPMLIILPQLGNSEACLAARVGGSLALAAAILAATFFAARGYYRRYSGRILSWGRVSYFL